MASFFSASTTRTLKDCTEFHSCQSSIIVYGADASPWRRVMKSSIGSSVPIFFARAISSARLQTAANWFPMPPLLLW